MLSEDLWEPGLIWSNLWGKRQETKAKVSVIAFVVHHLIRTNGESILTDMACS